MARGALVAAGMERVEADGSVYFRGGAGNSTVVLLHGANDHAGTWATVVASLLREHRVIAPDLAGHGESAPHEGPIALSLILEKLTAIIDRETSARVSLVGNSMGGWVALLYAIAHPERVQQLVLEDSSGMAWPVSVPLFAQSREQAVEMLRAVHGPDVAIEEWWIDALLARATSSPMLRVAQAGVAQYLVDARLQNIAAPTTLLWGESDGLLPLAYARALQEKIRGSQLQIIERAAHIPHLQKPERFNECLTAIFSPSVPA